MAAVRTIEPNRFLSHDGKRIHSGRMDNSARPDSRRWILASRRLFGREAREGDFVRGEVTEVFRGHLRRLDGELAADLLQAKTFG